jgi:spermidine synthase
VVWYFVFFLLSGFCSVLYELVWLRLSMAQFGVTTSMVSIVLSVFMAGLGLGSWASGRWLRQTEGKAVLPALRSYAIIELLIGVSGIVVPYGLLWGGRVLQTARLSSSFSHYSIAGILVALMLMPGCALMGATLPFGMRAIAQTSPNESRRSFSYLYMANVAGAVTGTILPLLFIEWLGFRATLKIGAACNCLIAVCALALSWKPVQAVATKRAVKPIRAGGAGQSQVSNGRNVLLLLFLSGLTSMAMEVVWVRRYAPYVGTVVYAFASILAVYLLATFVGSVIYRRWSSRNKEESPYLWIWLASFALLPLVSASPGVALWPLVRLIVGIAPFTGLLGWITPMLVDRFSQGDSTKAGKAYAVNVAGCILGPLLAGSACCLFSANAGRWFFSLSHGSLWDLLLFVPSEPRNKESIGPSMFRWLWPRRWLRPARDLTRNIGTGGFFATQPQPSSLRAQDLTGNFWSTATE